MCTQVQQPQQQPTSSGFVPPRTPGPSSSILSPNAATNSSVFMFNHPSSMPPQLEDQQQSTSRGRRALPPSDGSYLESLSLQPVQATVTPVAEPMANYESPMTTIEQIPNSNVLLNHSPSPPTHYRSTLMDKNLSLHSLPPSSPHSNTSSLASIPLHPVSPTSSPAHHDNASSLHTTPGFSWPYQQPMGGIPDFPQTLPYLPQVPAATPTSQHNSFFRVF